MGKYHTHDAVLVLTQSDNHIENLELTTLGEHITLHNKGYRDGYLRGYYDGKTQRIEDLEQRINSLERRN